MNNLPEELLPRIIGLYNSGTAEQFKDNNAILKLVLQKGARELENTVTQTLVGRLNNDEDVEGVLDVIASRDKWYARNKTQLKAMLEGKMPEDYDFKKSNVVELNDLQLKIQKVIESWL